MLQLAEKAKIRLLLGYADEFRYKSTRLESTLVNISDEAIDQVRSILSNLVTVENLILTTGLANIGLKRVDEIWFTDGITQINQQRKAGRIFIGQLSIIFGVPIFSDYFGSGGWLGDSFSGLGGRGSGGQYNVG